MSGDLWNQFWNVVINSEENLKKKSHQRIRNFFSDSYENTNILSFSFVVFVGKVFQQTVGIPMGTNCALFSPTSFCIHTKPIPHSLRFQRFNGKETVSISIQSHLQVHRWCIIHKQPRIRKSSGPDVSCWTWDQGHCWEHHVCFLPRFTSVDWDGWSTSHFHLRQTRWFQFPHHMFRSWVIPSSPAYGVFISQLIRYARACSSYECFLLRARRFSSKLLKQGYLVERLKSSFRKFYGRYGILFSNMKPPSHKCQMTFWPLTNSDFSTDQTFRQFHDLHIKLDQHRITSGFHGAFASGGMPAGNAYPSGHLVPSPIVELACAPIVETRFLLIAMSVLDCSPWIPLVHILSRFCLYKTKEK